MIFLLFTLLFLITENNQLNAKDIILIFTSIITTVAIVVTLFWNIRIYIKDNKEKTELRLENNQLNLEYKMLNLRKELEKIWDKNQNFQEAKNYLIKQRNDRVLMHINNYFVEIYTVLKLYNLNKEYKCATCKNNIRKEDWFDFDIKNQKFMEEKKLKWNILFKFFLIKEETNKPYEITMTTCPQCILKQ